jgi:hypothetical protein
VYRILVRDLKGRDHAEDLGVGEDKKMDVKEIGWEVVDWVLQAQDKDQWRTLVNTIMNHRIS